MNKAIIRSHHYQAEYYKSLGFYRAAEHCYEQINDMMKNPEKWNFEYIKTKTA